MDGIKLGEISQKRRANTEWVHIYVECRETKQRVRKKAIINPRILTVEWRLPESEGEGGMKNEKGAQRAVVEDHGCCGGVVWSYTSEGCDPRTLNHTQCCKPILSHKYIKKKM